jgi:(p)ppGpp synthase/HD superfamily hydrolase
MSKPNTWNRDLFAQTWHFATIKHSGQSYGGRLPEQQIDYINHLSSVAMEAMWVLANSTETYQADLLLQCALLHDTLEDTATDFEELSATFGRPVAEGVLALTKNKTLADKNQQMLDSLQRIQQQPKEIWMVKMADRTTNLYHPPFYWDKIKIAAYRAEAQIIYDHLASADALMAQRLAEKIEGYQTFL